MHSAMQNMDHQLMVSVSFWWLSMFVEHLINSHTGGQDTVLLTRHMVGC